MIVLNVMGVAHNWCSCLDSTVLAMMVFNIYLEGVFTLAAALHLRFAMLLFSST